MRAYQLTEFGLDGLKAVEKPSPTPGPYEALVEMRAASLNYRDLMVVKGQYNPKLRRPMVPLSDGVGHVVSVGSAVTRVKPGDRVAGAFMQRWLDGELTDEGSKSALGGAIDGVLAQQVVFHENGLVHVPEHLTDEEAATLPCAAVTAWHALVTDGRVKAGDVVLLQGTGGVSLFALQFAKLHGARIIITSSSDEKLERAKKLGANETINYKTTPKWDERALELTGGRGVDHVVEVGGAGTLGQSLRAVRSGGRISLIGVLSGGAGQINPLPILMKGACVQGIFVGSRTMFEEMNRALAANQLRPVIDRVFACDEIVAALQYLESAAHFGKIALRF